MTGARKLFIPIRKVDEATRTVYGVMTAEVVDKSGEIFDYETGKIAVQKWSDAQHEASQGKSLGNLREMHGNVAAGKVTDIVFNDAERTIEIATKVVDDGSWGKVMGGVLTGFSIGGGYEKRWPDPQNPAIKRYTPKMSEVSLVDNPCVPGALFEVVKADGSHEMRKFTNTTGAQEAQSTMTTNAPTDAIETPQPEQVWKCTDGSTEKTKRAALKKNAELAVAALTKGASAAIDGLAAELTKHEGEAPAAGAPEAAAGETPAADAAAAAPAITESATPGPDSAAAPAGTEQAPAAGGEAAAAPAAEAAPAAAEAPAAEAAKAAPATELKKGLYDVARLAEAIMCLNWLVTDTAWEARFEGDNSGVPAQIKEALGKLCEALKAMVEEETAELMASTDADVAAAKAAPLGALAKFLTDNATLAKAAGVDAFIEKLTKAAAPEPALTDEQLVKLEGYDTLAKAVTNIAPTIEALTKRLEKVESMPAEIKGVANTHLVRKNSHEAPAGTGLDEGLAKLISGPSSPDQVAQAMIKIALRNPTALEQPSAA